MKLMNFVIVLVILCGGVHISHCEILKCKFGDVGYSIGSFYSCEVTSLDVTNDSMVINGSSGTHKPNKTDAFVKGIYIHNTNTKYIPRNLGNIFNSNISTLSMSNTQLVEIKSQNFIGMENLEQLDLWNNKLTSIPLDVFSKLSKLKIISLSQNQIEEIPNGVFVNNLELEKIHLYKNKIKFIGSTLFHGLKKLNRVDLSENICIQKDFQGSSAIIQLKNNYKILCKNPNEAVLNMTGFSTEAPTATTPNPLELENDLIKELNINLEKENIELRNNLLESKSAQEKDQINRSELEAKNPELTERLSIYDAQKSTDLKFDDIIKKITILERIGNETLMNSEELHQKNCKLEQRVIDLTSALSTASNDLQDANEKNSKLELESNALNMEILEAKELRQSDRMVIIETKKDLLKLNEERQKDQLEMEKVKLELLKAIQQLSNCTNNDIIDL